MKSKLNLFIAALFAAAMVSCEDDEQTLKGDADLTHEGEEWNIASIEYDLVDQQTSGGGVGQTFKNGTKENVGTFYFKQDGGGSFEFVVDGYNKEDVFNFTMDGEQVTIVEISQTVGVQTNQNFLALSGAVVSDTERTLEGTIVKQSTSGNFVMNVDIVLKKR